MKTVATLLVCLAFAGCRSKSESKPAPTAETPGSQAVAAVPADAAEPVEEPSDCQLPAPHNAKIYGFQHDVDGIGEQLVIPELEKLCTEQKWSRAFDTCLFAAEDLAGRMECQKQLKPEVASALDARVATFVKKLDDWATKTPDCNATAAAYYSDAAIAKQKSVLSQADRARAMAEMKKLMADRCKTWPKLLANCVRYNDQPGAVGEAGADQCLNTAGEGIMLGAFPSGAVSLPSGVASCDRYLKLAKVPACAKPWDFLSRLISARSGLFESGDDGEKEAADAACKEALANAPKGCPAK